MFVFLGSFSGGGGGSSGDDDSQDDGATDDDTQTGVDDYTGDDGGDDSDEDSGDGKAAAAGVAGAAGAAAGAGAASGAAGAGAAAGSGAGAGTGTEPPEGDDPEDKDGSDEGEDCEDEEEKEEQPEPPDIEEPDIEPEDDVDEPETEREPEEEDGDESDDVEEDTEEEEDTDDEDDEEEEEEDTDDEDDEEEEEEDEEDEDETVVVVQEVDALSAMSWGVQPVMKRVEECYGEEIELFYKPAPVREIDPEQEKQKWIDVGQQLGMPVDPSFWDEDPPESTELVNKAFEAADRQWRGMDYIRAMWRRGVAAGRDINDREVLVDLASDLGLDQERFEEDLDKVELESGGRGELPFTFMKIQGKPVPKNGRVRYSDFKTQFTFQGIEEQEPQELQDFVEEHGPVATPEVTEVYGIRREEAVNRLQDVKGVSSFEVGGEDFWY